MNKQKILLSIFFTFVFIDATFLIYKSLTKKDQKYTIIKTTTIVEKKGLRNYEKSEHLHVDYLASGVDHDVKYKSECTKNENGDQCTTYLYDYDKNTWKKLKLLERHSHDK